MSRARTRTLYILIYGGAKGGHRDSIDVVRREDRARGVLGVGIHFFVNHDGVVSEGRPHEEIGIHSEGNYDQTSVSIRIADPDQQGFYTEEQLSALRCLIKKHR